MTITGPIPGSDPETLKLDRAYSFAEMLELKRKDDLEWKTPERLLCLDPGDTTGFAFFRDGVLTSYEQCSRKSETMLQLIEHYRPQVITCERYVIYSWKTETHAWSDVPTLRLIGVIEFICMQKKIMLVMQGTQAVKNFCTDKRLKEWGYFNKEKKHSMDAVRHGCFYLLFGKLKPKGNATKTRKGRD